jgi:hypothetical protein
MKYIQFFSLVLSLIMCGWAIYDHEMGKACAWFNSILWQICYYLKP